MGGSVVKWKQEGWGRGTCLLIRWCYTGTCHQPALQIQAGQNRTAKLIFCNSYFFYYCNQLEDNTSHKHHCSFSENGKQNKTTFIYFLPRYWTTLIFTCSDEIGLEIILWQNDCTIRRELNIYWKNQHLGVLCITSHRSITVLHFDISNLWLSNIQLSHRKIMAVL